MARDIQERTYCFALEIVRLAMLLGEMNVMRVIGNQVLRSGCSIGANVEEAQAAHSKRDFAYRMLIALREARETHYWLRLIGDSCMLRTEYLFALVDEAEQLTRILGSIVSKVWGQSKLRST